MNESNPTQSNDASHRGHEPDVVNSRLLIISGAGLVLLVALALLLVYATNRFLADQMPRAAEKPPGVRPTYTRTAPQITSAQPQLLRELRQSEQQRLTTYEWIDQPAGIARIPIDRAVDILAKKGLSTGVSKSEEHDDNKSE